MKLKNIVEKLELKQKEERFKHSIKHEDDDDKETKPGRTKPNIKIEWKTRQEVEQIKKEKLEIKEDKTEDTKTVPRLKRYKKSSKDWEVETSEEESDGNGDQNQSGGNKQLETNENFNQNFQKYLENLDKIQKTQVNDFQKNNVPKFDIDDFKKIKKEILYDGNEKENIEDGQKYRNNSFDIDDFKKIKKEILYDGNEKENIED